MKNKIIVLLVLILSLLSVPTFAVGTDTDSIENIGAVTEINEVEEERIEVLFPKNVKMGMETIEEVVEKESEETGKVEKITETHDVLAFYDADNESEDAEPLFTVEDEEYTIFMEDICLSTQGDAKAGLDALAKSSVTLDHIKLSVWGSFLHTYYGKTMLNFPMGDIKIKYDKNDFNLKVTDESKDFVLNTFIPTIIDTIVEESRNYPAKSYVLNSKGGTLLKDYECDLTDVIEKKAIYPLTKDDTYQFLDAGSYFCMCINTEYVNILRGYIENAGYYRRVDTGNNIPGCVNVLAYVTLLRDVDGGTVSDKCVNDFTLYQNLAITLDTKELIDVTNMTTANKSLDYKEYSLNIDNLVVSTVEDGIVVIQPTYLECFKYAGVNSTFSATIDTTDFIQGKDDCFRVVETGEKIKYTAFTDNGILMTDLGNAPFLIYYSSYVPYNKLVNFAYNQQDIYFNYFDNKDELVENFVNTIKNDLKAQNRSADFDAYLKAAGQKTSTEKMIIKIVIAVIVIAVLAVGFILIRKKYKEVNAPTETPNSKETNDVLFEDDDDDDDGSDFELK